MTGCILARVTSSGVKGFRRPIGPRSLESSQSADILIYRVDYKPLFCSGVPGFRGTHVADRVSNITSLYVCPVVFRIRLRNKCPFHQFIRDNYLDATIP